MNRFEEQMLDRDLEELLGGERPGDLSGRIIAAAEAPRRQGRPTRRTMPLPRERRSRAPAMIGIAACFAIVLALALMLGSALSRREVTPSPGVAGGNSAKEKPACAPAPAVNAPASQDQPKTPEIAPKEPPREELPPEPRPQPNNDVKKPEEKPQPDQPKMPDEPKKPEERVDKPKPDETKPPEPKPQPAPEKVATVLAQAKGAKLQLRYSETEPWRDAAQEPLNSGAALRATQPVDLTLVGGALLRFSGQLCLDGAKDELAITLLERATQAWCDNLGCSQNLNLGYKDLRAQLPNGAALFEANLLSMEISCFHGLVASGGAKVNAGSFAVLGEKGLGKARELTAAEQSPRLLSGLPARSLLREEFEVEPAGKLYGGAIEKGVAKVAGAGGLLAFDIKPSIIAVPGATLRMRYRVTACENIYVQFLGVDVARQFGNEFTQARSKQGQWLEFELRLDALPDDASGAPGRKMPAGLELGKFQCYVRGEKNCTLEIEWIEVVRVQQ